MRRGITIALAAAALVLATGPAAAQGLTGELGVAYVWQQVAGNEASFRSQRDLDEGGTLESLRLDWAADGRAFHLAAWGFGEAEPTSHARVRLEPGGPWRIRLDYDRRESFFDLGGDDPFGRRDDWAVSRWHGRMDWDGWDAARISFELRRVDRTGTALRPLYGLNQLYPVRQDLDESLTEGVIRLVTTRLPVRIELEQAYAAYRRRNRIAPLPGGIPLDPSDPDLLADAATRFDDDQDVPTTRAALSWAGDRVEVAASLLWSSADLDRTGSGWSTFAVGGGEIGTVEYVDTIVSSAAADTLAGTVRVSAALGRGWRLRLDATYRDRQVDSTLLGERLLRVTNPLGTGFEFPASLAENGLFDTTDSRVELGFEHDLGRLTYWFGGFATGRDVTWRRTAEGETEDVSRDSSGGRFGLAYRGPGGLLATAEYEHGDFERYVFRTDPATVDRLSSRLRLRLSGGLALTARLRIEQASNPASVAGRSTSATAVAVGCAWSSPDGSATAGLDLGTDAITTDTDLVLPGGAAGRSRYDLALWTATGYASGELGPVKVDASVVWLSDRGETWPVDAWSMRLRAAVPAGAGTRVAAFVNYWSYDERLAEIDDFTATRYGIALSWSF